MEAFVVVVKEKKREEPKKHAFTDDFVLKLRESFNEFVAACVNFDSREISKNEIEIWRELAQKIKDMAVVVHKLKEFAKEEEED